MRTSCRPTPPTASNWTTSTPTWPYWRNSWPHRPRPWRRATGAWAGRCGCWRRRLEDLIRKCVITSPATGTVLAKYAEPGELAAQGRALFKVGSLEEMYLRAYVTAPQLTMLKIGQSVRVFADMGEKDRREYPGTVTWISDQAEFTPKTIQTRDERANLVYAVKVAVKNDGYIKRGMYGEIKFSEE